MAMMPTTGSKSEPAEVKPPAKPAGESKVKEQAAAATAVRKTSKVAEAVKKDKETPVIHPDSLFSGDDEEVPF
jgi:hypothetical protein